MVCLNTQTPDEDNAINDAFFRDEYLRPIGYLPKQKIMFQKEL